MAQLQKNIGFASIGHLIYTLLAFLLIPFATRYLGVINFGVYSLATTVGFFVNLLTDLGMSILLTREISKHRKIAKALFDSFMGIKSVLVLSTIGLLLLYLQVGDFTATAFHTILIYSVSSIISSYTQNIFSVFRGFERIEYESLGMSLDKFLSVILGILFLIAGFDIRIFISSFVIASLVKLFVITFILQKHFFKPGIQYSFSRNKVLMLTALPFGLSNLLALCYNYFDILMLSAMTNFRDVGWYNGSYKFLSLTTLVPIVLTAGLLPQLSVHHKNRKELTGLFLKGVTYLFMVSIPMVPVILLSADWIVNTVLGPELYGSIISLKILVFAAFAQMLNYLFVSLFAAVNQQKKILYFQIIGLVINLVLNLILIPVISYRGAAFATIVTEWIILIFIVVWASIHIFTSTKAWKVFVIKTVQLLFSTVIITLILWLLIKNQMATLLALFISAGIYVLCLQLFKVVDLVALSHSVLARINHGEN